MHTLVSQTLYFSILLSLMSIALFPRPFKCNIICTLLERHVFHLKKHALVHQTEEKAAGCVWHFNVPFCCQWWSWHSLFVPPHIYTMLHAHLQGKHHFSYKMHTIVNHTKEKAACCDIQIIHFLLTYDHDTLSLSLHMEHYVQYYMQWHYAHL